MRVIAGQFGGRRIKAPSGTGTRPTSDRVREALFNILGPPPEDCQVLDLFAGSGALAIEALSRGAAHAVMIEANRGAARTLRENLTNLGLVDHTTLLEQRAEVAMNDLEGRYQWIFIDPPYASDLGRKCLHRLVQSRLIHDDAVIVYEHASKATAPDVADLIRREPRRYGDTALSFYYRKRP